MSYTISREKNGMTEHKTRESWYLAAVKQIESRVFKSAGYELPKFRIGCGWPVTSKTKTGAECFSRECSGDKTYEIFISPKFDDSFHILEMLVHELCHTIAGIEAKHKKPFIEVMRTVGMVRPWKGSQASEHLAATLTTIQEKLGPYPHAKLELKQRGAKKQNTRLLKAVCPKCNYTIRVTRKWIDEAGLPQCPTHKVAFQEEKREPGS
jgi:predicted SprT family Zn-dependent metalloprotease